MKGPISSRKAKTREAQKRSGKPGWHSFRPYAVVLCALLVTGLAVVWRFRLIPQTIPQPPSVAENPGAGTANAATATGGVIAEATP